MTLYKVILTCKSVDEILVCDHSNESYYTVVPCDTVCHALQSDSNFGICSCNPVGARGSTTHDMLKNKQKDFDFVDLGNLFYLCT